MLAVGVELNCYIVVVVEGVFVASLYGAADAKVSEEVDVVVVVVFENLACLVSGTVIDDDVIVFFLEYNFDGLFY